MTKPPSTTPRSRPSWWSLEAGKPVAPANGTSKSSSAPRSSPQSPCSTSPTSMKTACSKQRPRQDRQCPRCSGSAGVVNYTPRSNGDLRTRRRRPRRVRRPGGPKGPRWHATYAQLLGLQTYQPAKRRSGVTVKTATAPQAAGVIHPTSSEASSGRGVHPRRPHARWLRHEGGG